MEGTFRLIQNLLHSRGKKGEYQFVGTSKKNAHCASLITNAGDFDDLVLVLFQTGLHGSIRLSNYTSCTRSAYPNLSSVKESIWATGRQWSVYVLSAAIPVHTLEINSI